MTSQTRLAGLTTKIILALSVSLTNSVVTAAVFAQGETSDTSLHNSSLPLPYLHFAGADLSGSESQKKPGDTQNDATASDAKKQLAPVAVKESEPEKVSDAVKNQDFASSPFLSAKNSVTKEEAVPVKDAVDGKESAKASESVSTDKTNVAKNAESEKDPFAQDYKAVPTLENVANSEKAPETAFVTGIGGNGILDKAPIVIDNDEKKEVEEKVDYENLPTDEGKTRIKAGARFPVVITTQITSKTAKEGDAFQARLKYDIKIGDRLVAKKGDVVNGHINYALKARTAMSSLVSPERWYRNSGTLGVSFDEIVTEAHEHIPLNAQPARMARIVKNKAEGRELGVNHKGQITGPWSQQLKYKAVRIGLNAALSPAGVFSFGAMPVALGVIGAANPSFAFMKPVGQNVRHRRLKGFAWGFLSGVPGSWLVEDTIVKGQEAVIEPGDEFLVEFNQEFTGEPASDAELIPGATTKVHGQVINAHKKKK